MQRMIWNGGNLVPDTHGREMLTRMIVGLVEGRSREEIVADEMARLTLAADAAGTDAGKEAMREWFDLPFQEV